MSNRATPPFWVLMGISLLLLVLHTLRVGFLECSEPADAVKQAAGYLMVYAPLFALVFLGASLLAWAAGRRWHWPSWFVIAGSSFPMLWVIGSVYLKIPTERELFAIRTGLRWPSEMAPILRWSVAREHVWLFEGEPSQIDRYLETIAASGSVPLQVGSSNPGALLDDSGEFLWPAFRIAQRGPAWIRWEGGIAYPIGGSKDDNDPWGWGAIVADKDRRHLGVEWGR